MDKSKGYRKALTFRKKKEKKTDRNIKILKSHQDNLTTKSAETLVQHEIEIALRSKRIDKSICMDLERQPLIARAIFLGGQKAVEVALESCENINVILPDGNTALTLALERGSPRIVHMLLQKGADPTIPREDGMNALMLAVQMNDKRLISILWNKCNEYYEWDFNHADVEGRTLLTISIEQGAKKLVELLLSLDADVNKQLNDGKTALMIAVLQRSVNIVQELLGHGADVLIEDKNGATALCLSIAHNGQEMTDLLFRSLKETLLDIYVKKRIEVVKRPCADPDFQQTILFPVLLEIQRRLGSAVMHRHCLFPSLLTCATLDERGRALSRSILMLSARLMRDELREQFVESGGADFALEVIEISQDKGWQDVRAAAFLPLHACAIFASGQSWLRNNYRDIKLHSQDFRTALWSYLSFPNEEEEKEALGRWQAFENFLQTIQKDLTSSGESGNFEHMKAPPEDLMEKVALPKVCTDASTSDSMKSTSHRVAEIPRKLKDIKFQSKVYHDHELKVQKPVAQFVPVMFPFAPNVRGATQTGYADALKRNLKAEPGPFHHEEDLTVEQKVLKKFNMNVKSFAAAVGNARNYAKISNRDLEIGNVIDADDDELPLKLKKISRIHELKNMYELPEPWLKMFEPVKFMSLLAEWYYRNVCLAEHTRTSERHRDEVKVDPLKYSSGDSRKKILAENGAEVELDEVFSGDFSRKIPSSMLVGKRKSCDAVLQLQEIYSEKVSNQTGSETVTRSKYLSVGGLRRSQSFGNALNSYEGFAQCNQEQTMKVVESLKIKHTPDAQYGNVDYETKSNISNEDTKMISKRDEKQLSYASVLKKPQKHFSDKCSESFHTCMKAAKNFIVPKIPFRVLKNNFKHKKSTTYFSTSSSVMSEKKSILKTDTFLNSPSKATSEPDTINGNSGCFGGKSGIDFMNLENYFDQSSKYRTMSRSLRVNNSTNWKFCRSMNQQVVFLDGPQLPSFRLKSKLERLQKYAFYCERLIHRNLLNRKDCLARNKPSRPSLKERLSMGGKVFVEKYGALFQNPYAADAELQEFQPVQNDTSNDAEELTEIIKDSKEDITYIERDSDLKVGEDNINLIYQQDLDSSASIFGDHHSFKFSTVHHSASSPDLRSNENLIENIDHPPYMSLRDFSSFNDWNMTRLDWLRAIRDSREKETHVQRIETELKPKIRDSVIWETVRYQASGYTPRFVNLERSSQWYGLLKNMHGCVPLSAFLMEPSHNHDCSEDALHKLKLVCGNAHFCTRDEYRLEDSKHHTYLGLLEDGSPATVRRLNTSTSTATEVGMLLFKKRSLKHKNVLKFYDAVVNPVNNHLYAVSELCEYSLRQYLKRCSDCNGRRPSPYSAPFDAKLLITDLMGALKYLHRMQIVHGFLKPSNILVTDYGTLKVADLYLLDCATLVHGIHDTEVKLCPIGLELSDFCWRPYEVIQSSNEEEARSNIGTASDIQMAGMIVYYILTGGRHPFGSTERECQENILLGQPALGGEPGDTESRVLIQDMIRKEESERPLISEVTLHPYFWDIEKRFLFLTLVARKIDFYTKKKTKAAEAFRDSCIEAEDWVSSVPTSLMTYIVQAANRKFGNNFADLLKFSLEIKDSFDRMPQNLKLMVKHPSHYILQVFPTFFMSVYHVIKNSLLLQRQMELLSFFNAFIT